MPSHVTDIDNENSVVIETLAGLRMGKWDSPEVLEKKRAKLKRLREEKCCKVSHCEGDTLKLEPRKHTLFVNAAVEPVDEGRRRFPWVVEIELSRQPGRFS
ncbi:hypothetical protein NEUTE2DRAFT_58234 [Neurospora tetrasperma FGSC 2509]|nr:hypothetical protein NEUTE2DRAFT_58234 [Neurospora tetrasperma FGSC 2509]